MFSVYIGLFQCNLDSLVFKFDQLAFETTFCHSRGLIVELPCVLTFDQFGHTTSHSMEENNHLCLNSGTLLYFVSLLTYIHLYEGAL